MDTDRWMLNSRDPTGCDSSVKICVSLWLNLAIAPRKFATAGHGRQHARRMRSPDTNWPRS
jgi:hypothetical protein